MWEFWIISFTFNCAFVDVHPVKVVTVVGILSGESWKRVNWLETLGFMNCAKAHMIMMVVTDKYDSNCYYYEAFINNMLILALFSYLFWLVFRCLTIWAWAEVMNNGQRHFWLTCRKSGEDVNKFGGLWRWKLVNAIHKPLFCNNNLP